jgi:hypothetical protein
MDMRGSEAVNECGMGTNKVGGTGGDGGGSSRYMHLAEGTTEWKRLQRVRDRTDAFKWIGDSKQRKG